MAEIKLVHVPGHKPIRILQWLVKKGELVKHGTPLAVYRHVEDPSKQIKTKEIQLKSKHVGTVKMYLMHEGEVAIPEGVLMEIEGCCHPVVIKDMCAECGQDLRALNEENVKNEKRKTNFATISMIPNVPEIRISAEQAEEIAQQDKDYLHRMRKLALLVDLDQTLIHTTQDPGLAALCQSNDDFYSFQLSKNDPMLFTKLRPHCRDFLEEISQRYELQIVTFGSRQYAHKIADFIDKEKKYFAHRILSRDECIHPFKKSGNLRHLFPCGDSMVCIIDDRDDVWNAVPNLIMVKKYSYFQGTGDINNPHKKTVKKEEGDAPKNDNGAQFRRKRKSEEDLDAAGEESNAKRTKEDANHPEEVSSINVDEKNEKSSPKLDSNENNIEERIGDEEAVVDDDLNLSSDSDSSSDSSSNSSGSDSSSSDGEDISQKNENLQQNSQNSEKVENGDEEIKSKIKLQSDKISDDNAKKCVVSTIVSPIEQVTSNGKNLEKVCEISDTEANSSSAETLIISSQESQTKDTNSQETLDREVSGFSIISQEFTTTLSSQDSTDDCGKKFYDTDDYLTYLKDILIQIHKTYYEAYDKFVAKEFSNLPDVRGVVPFLRSKVLYGNCIVFTGVIPQSFGPPERHRAHCIARQLGAQVEEQISDKTTHLIAAKKGTTKYQEAIKRKKQKIKMVAVEWLWCCSERWEKVEERLFPVPNKFVESANREKLSTETSQPEKIIDPEQSQTPQVNTYDPVTGKLIKKVQDPRFTFMVAESQHRKIEKSKMPLYSSLQVPNAVIPVNLSEKSQKIFEKNSKGRKHNALSKSNTSPAYASAPRSRKRSMAEMVGIGYSLSTDDIADMDKEVHDLLGSSDEDEDDTKKTASLMEHDQPSTSKTDVISQDGESEQLGTVIEEPTESPTSSGSPQEDKEESDASDAEKESSEEEFDEMAALLDAEMHYETDEN